MDRRTFLASAAAATGAGAAAGCVAPLLGGGLSEDEYDVGMSASAFLPAEYEVRVGDTVVWGNSGSRRHTVTAYGGAIPTEADYFASGGFDSERAAREAWRRGDGAIASGATYEHTFEAPGRYQYCCLPHEPAGMVGTIVVRE